MKKLYSLINACMTNDMNVFHIKRKRNQKKSIVILISLCFMFAIWSNANIIFEKMAPMHLQVIVLSMVVFLISIITIIEGIYKTGPLLFNCKDDQLLLSLPIKRKTVLFVRIFKFYVFEFFFNCLFLIPLIVAYIRWADTLEWTFFLTSFVMLFVLPIIPIIISCIIGVITSSISSRFQYKNLAQIITTTMILLIIFYLSLHLESCYDYLVKHATSINELIIKIYYPAGVYASLVMKFNLLDLIIFLLINILLFALLIVVLSKFYFQINSRLKNVITTKKIKVDDLVIKTRSINTALIKKELNTFFKTPVFIVNAGFGLVLFVIATIGISFKFDSILSILIDSEVFHLSKDLIHENISILVFALISFTSFMTSITNSVISLEGKNINIIKSLPLKTKTVLMSKIYSALVLTTPILLIGEIVLFVRFKIDFIEMVLLIILSILIPLVSHFIGLIVNLKYPKLDAENSAEVVKQSTSSFVAVMIGMILLVLNIAIITKTVGLISSSFILTMATIIYIIIDIILYLYLIHKGIKDFDNLSI